MIDFINSLSQRDIRELRHCRSVSSGLLTKQFANLFEFVGRPADQAEALCVTLLLCARVSKKNNDGFLRSLGGLSTDKRPSGTDIIEKRFLRLIRADDWDSFYIAAEVCVRVLVQQTKSVDVNDLIGWVNRRADSWQRQDLAVGTNQFGLLAADDFYSAQQSVVKGA